MPAPLRVALIGYGLAGSAFHAPFIATIPDFRLAAIVTRSDERRARALRDHPGVPLFASADEVWANSNGFDQWIGMVRCPYPSPLLRILCYRILRRTNPAKFH